MTRQCFDEFHRLFGIRYPFGDYHQAFVPGVQRRRDGEPRLRHLPRPAASSPAGSPGASASRGPPPSRTRWRTSGSATSSPRSGGTTCGSTSRSPSTWATGSPPTSREYDDAWIAQRLRAPPVGPDRRPAAEHPPGRRQRRGRRHAPRCRTSTASPTPRARASSSSSTPPLGDEVFFAGVDRPLRAAPVRQRDDARPVRQLGARRRRRPVDASPTTGCAPPARTLIVLDRAAGVLRRTPPGRPPRRPAAHVPRRGRGAGRHLDGPRPSTVDGPETPLRRPATRPVRARPLRGHLGAASSPTE